MKGKTLLLLSVLGLGCSSLNAKDSQKELLATPNFYGSTVSFSVKLPASSSSITISGPNEFVAQKTVKYGVPNVQLTNFGQVVDGLYHYRLVVNSGPKVLLTDNRDNGRNTNKEYYGVKGMVQSGHFYVKYGNIQTFKQTKEPINK